MIRSQCIRLYSTAGSVIRDSVKRSQLYLETANPRIFEIKHGNSRRLEPFDWIQLQSYILCGAIVAVARYYIFYNNGNLLK